MAFRVGVRTKVTPGEIEQWRILWQDGAGLSLSQIALLAGRNKTQISYHLRPTFRQRHLDALWCLYHDTHVSAQLHSKRSAKARQARIQRGLCMECLEPRINATMCVEHRRQFRITNLQAVKRYQQRRK